MAATELKFVGRGAWNLKGSDDNHMKNWGSEGEVGSVFRWRSKGQSKRMNGCDTPDHMHTTYMYVVYNFKIWILNISPSNRGSLILYLYNYSDKRLLACMRQMRPNNDPVVYKTHGISSRPVLFFPRSNFGDDKHRWLCMQQYYSFFHISC